MASIGKIILGTGAAAGLIWLVSALMGKKKLGDKLDTRTLATIHKFDLKGGLVIRVEVVLSNPTQYSLRIKKPYVRLLLEKDLIGASEIKDVNIEIKPYNSEKMKESIFVTIPTVKLLSLGKGLYQSLIQKKPVKLNVQTISQIDLGVKWIGYQQDTPITLNVKLPALPLMKKSK